MPYFVSSGRSPTLVIKCSPWLSLNLPEPCNYRAVDSGTWNSKEAQVCGIPTRFQISWPSFGSTGGPLWRPLAKRVNFSSLMVGRPFLLWMNLSIHVWWTKQQFSTSSFIRITSRSLQKQHQSTHVSKKSASVQLRDGDWASLQRSKVLCMCAQCWVPLTVDLTFILESISPQAGMVWRLCHFRTSLSLLSPEFREAWPWWGRD